MATNMNQQPSYWFPTMKVTEIKAILDEWQLPVTEQQIKQPTGEVVQALYSTLLQQLTGISEEVLEESVTRALLIADEFPELYATSLRLNFLLYHIRRLAFAARIQDFCMRDLILPDPERTRSMLSALINFVKFAIQQEQDLRKFRDHSVAALTERDRLAVEVAELRRKISEIQTQRAQDEPRCRLLKEENAQITASLISTKGQQEALVKAVDSLKKERSTLTRQKESVLSEVQLVRNSILSIKSRIVQSPDRIKKHISEMGFMAQEERMIVSNNESKSRELKSKLDALNVFEQDIKKCVDDLRIISEEHTNLGDSLSKLATFRNELEKRRIHREQLFGRGERSRRQLDKAEDKLNRMRRLATEQQKKAEEEIARLTKEYAEMSEERRDNDRQVEELKQEASEIERKMLEHLRKNEAELNELLAEYWTLRHQTEVYMETLTETLGMEIVSS